MADPKLMERALPGGMRRGPGARFAEVEHAENVGATLKRILTYFAKEKAMVIAMLAVVILGTLCGVYAPACRAAPSTSSRAPVRGALSPPWC